MEEVLKIASSSFGIHLKDLTPMRGGHFARVYLFQRAGMDFILRLAPPNEDVDVRAQRSIFDWMSFLAAHGAAVPEPQPSLKGNLIEVIPATEGDWLAVVFTRAAGILSEELPIQQWNQPLFQALGKTIGRAHAISRHYEPAPGICFPQWDQGGNLFNQQIQYELWLKEKQTRLMEQIQRFQKSPETYGLIHGDLHFGNFFVHEATQVITLIDFDDCAYGWFSMDIALLLFDILVLYQGNERDKFGHDFLRSFLAGYLPENPLPSSWVDQVPLFLKLLEINLYDMMAKYYPNELGEWGAKFMPGRKERLDGDIPYLNLGSLPG
jgi:Ser/Thr protein kinase RdoA (MazF antagonist)